MSTPWSCFQITARVMDHNEDTCLFFRLYEGSKGKRYYMPVAGINSDTEFRQAFEDVVGTDAAMFSQREWIDLIEVVLFAYEKLQPAIDSVGAKIKEKAQVQNKNAVEQQFESLGFVKCPMGYWHFGIFRGFVNKGKPEIQNLTDSSWTDGDSDDTVKSILIQIRSKLSERANQAMDDCMPLESHRLSDNLELVRANMIQMTWG